MCIIAYGIKRDVGTTHFNNCLKNNPDGFFLMGVKRGTTKGKPDFFIRTLIKKDVVCLWNKIPDDYMILLHARIKTHGSISEENIHGWNYNGWYFCHNGILSLKNKDDMTDSETFFKYIFIPAFKDCTPDDKNEDFANLINPLIGSSKFAFYKKGKFMFFGDFIRPDKNKFAYFSNSTYEGSRYIIDCDFDLNGLEKHKNYKSYGKLQKNTTSRKYYYTLNSKLQIEKRFL